MVDEFDAMKRLEEIILSLEEEQKPRVLQWFWSRFAQQAASTNGIGGRAIRTAAGPSTDRGNQYETFAELFDAANPNVERDKALVAAYWVQVCQNAQSFPSQALNSELKDLGHGIGNITEALTQLKESRPALILQLKKSGLAKQARKTYKLTQEGIRRIESMIRGEADLDVSE